MAKPRKPKPIPELGETPAITGIPSQDIDLLGDTTSNESKETQIESKPKKFLGYHPITGVEVYQ